MHSHNKNLLIPQARPFRSSATNRPPLLVPRSSNVSPFRMANPFARRAMEIIRTPSIWVFNQACPAFATAVPSVFPPHAVSEKRALRVSAGKVPGSSKKGGSLLMLLRGLPIQIFHSRVIQVCLLFLYLLRGRS